MPNKFRNVRTNGFASKKEAKRVVELQLLAHSGVITDLVLQPVFRIVINDQLVCKYIADASYRRDGKLIVEDTKSAVTAKHPVYRLKKKLMLAVHGIEIQEV